MRKNTKPEQHIEQPTEAPDELETSEEEGKQPPPFDYDIRDTIEKLSS